MGRGRPDEEMNKLLPRENGKNSIFDLHSRDTLSLRVGFSRGKRLPLNPSGFYFAPWTRKIAFKYK